ncbi:outer membrane protein [Paracoccus tibetensis]|uniref:Outer membrane immunogenic protein n=1 Tax=Paracoccus tibetensis TaxID=336292 RepID=A0A1G5EKJ0_9RHOB|nr:outer membrane beta-barrel protein [Paracoccus tibetensis]SCY27507.1 outer membrane immunogenic protein [Paracoccus tibetensis]
MSMKSILAACVASGALISGASAALAGGFVAPSVEVEPIVAAPVATTGDWAGAYVGGSIGYSFGGDDTIGFNATDDDGFGVGSVDVKGATAGVRAGYRLQRGNWVFGPELAVEGGSVDASDIGDFGDAALDVESSVKNIVSLVLKTGYVVNPQTLVYGTLGAARGSFDYTLSDGETSETQGYRQTGAVFGIGAERAVSARTSVFAEYQFRNFGSTSLTYDTTEGEVTTVATPQHSNIQLGMNFRF